MPKLQKLYRRLEGQGLALIAIHTKNGSERMASWMQDNGIELPVCVDTNEATVRAYAVDSYPDYYVIDRSGKLRVADLANGDLEHCLSKLLAEPAPKDRPVASSKAVAPKKIAKTRKQDATLVFEKARKEARRSKRKLFAYLSAPW